MAQAYMFRNSIFDYWFDSFWSAQASLFDIPVGFLHGIPTHAFGKYRSAIGKLQGATGKLLESGGDHRETIGKLEKNH